MLWQNRIFLTIFALSLLVVQKSFCQTDTLLQGEYLKYERELVSPLNIFKLKFFKFENSDNWYFGIWYINAYVQDRAVWIANRNNPISERSGSGRLIVDSFGRLRILRGASSLLELSSTKTTRNTTLKLLDSGNLQLQEMDSNGSMRSVLWESFDYPTDTLLPGMKLGFNVKTGKKWELTSYLGDTLPVSGSFVFGMDANITNQLTILWRGNIFWESGLWFEGGFSMEELNRKGFVFSFVSTEAEHYFMYSTDQSYERPLFPRIMIDQQGILHIYMLHTPSIYLKRDQVYREKMRDYCSLFSPEKKNICYSQYSSRVNEGFLFADMAYKAGNCSPFASTFTEMRSSSLDKGFVLNETGGRFSRYDCYVHCLQNCSCLAYASAHVDGTGCEIWNTDPTNKGLSSHRDRRTIYIRQKEYVYHEKNEKAPVWLVVVTSVCVMISLIWLLIYLVLRKLQIKVTPVIRGLFYFVHGLFYLIHREIIPQIPVMMRGLFYFIRGLFYFIHREIIPQMMGCIRRRILSQRVGSTIDQEILLRELGIDRRRQHRRSSLRKNNNELQIFSFESVALATDYFSSENKLGEGGFGSVYKVHRWRRISRLSLASGQGLVEFKNEAMLIAKLQHTNLVQLMGCCIDKDEKMLIYEYMPNKSLDYFIFDPLRKNIMDWTLRFRIMEGIIQGLLYLHKYSRLKVIHRDIKASNILLDEDMSPKISDFGMARIFGAQESKANTNRVAGTFGYMSPEYFREGLFSAKSDVFSFGVLMLEIICGRRNNSFNCESEGPLNLIVHVWNLFKENRLHEVIDPSLGDSAVESPQVLRCVQVALLCVQENAEDRPSMLDVVSMIYGEGNNALSLPKEPAFYDGPRRSSPEVEVEPPEMENVSVNRVTISVMEAR